MRFQALFTFDDEYKGFVVEVPELPGCFSQGKTLEEATVNIKDAIRGVLHVMESRGEAYRPSIEPTFVGEVTV